MRTKIFYWKCDSPIPTSQKINCFFSSKYSSTMVDHVEEAIHDFLGHSMGDFQVIRSDGNHLVCRFKDKGAAYILRADEGNLTNDVYMLAESSVMTLLNQNGLPVPPVYHTDISMKRYPFRYQIMEFVSFPSLNTFAQDGTLNESRIAKQLGRFLARIHQFHFHGYGFFNTDKLAEENTLEGLDKTAADYFEKCMEDHIGYLTGHDLLSSAEEARIRNAFAKALPLLNGINGSLLHRDCVYWNILGTQDNLERVIDWDDCISGDPADDLGIVNCVLPEALMKQVIDSYTETETPEPSFYTRIHLHTLRNMLWKAMIRSYMGYFDKGKKFFLSGRGMPLREYTLFKIKSELEKLERAL